ncbi:unnamed protein product [Urochloa humidicola]
MTATHPPHLRRRTGGVSTATGASTAGQSGREAVSAGLPWAPALSRTRRGKLVSLPAAWVEQQILAAAATADPAGLVLPGGDGGLQQGSVPGQFLPPQPATEDWRCGLRWSARGRRRRTRRRRRAAAGGGAGAVRPSSWSSSSPASPSHSPRQRLPPSLPDPAMEVGGAPPPPGRSATIPCYKNLNDFFTRA